MCYGIPLVRNTTLYSTKSQCLCEGRRNIIFDDTNNFMGRNRHNADLLLSSCNVDFGSSQVLVEQLGPLELNIGDGTLVLQVTQNGENKQKIGGFSFRFNYHKLSPFSVFNGKDTGAALLRSYLCHRTFRHCLLSERTFCAKLEAVLFRLMAKTSVFDTTPPDEGGRLNCVWHALRESNPSEDLSELPHIVCDYGWAGVSLLANRVIARQPATAAFGWVVIARRWLGNHLLSQRVLAHSPHRCLPAAVIQSPAMTIHKMVFVNVLRAEEKVLSLYISSWDPSKRNTFQKTF